MRGQHSGNTEMVKSGGLTRRNETKKQTRKNNWTRSKGRGYVWSSTTASVAGMLDSIMQGDPPAAAAAAGLDVPMQIEFIPPRLAVRTAIYHRHGGWMLGHGRAGERDNEPYQRGVVLIQRPAASARGAGAARLTTHESTMTTCTMAGASTDIKTTHICCRPRILPLLQPAIGL
jgi:hypothetical protein